MQQYLDLCKEILHAGVWKSPARPGMPKTKSINSVMMKFDLSKGFPLLTTKKMYTKGIFTELLWLLRGETNIHYLLQHDCHVWDGDAYKYYCKRCKQFIAEPLKFDVWLKYVTETKCDAGEMGHIYGWQWRHIPERDQITYLIDNIKNTPSSRYHILESWNVKDIAEQNMALPPCHKQMQFFVRDGYLDMMFYIRSSDVPLGLPFNIACYATILELFCKILQLRPGILTYIGGDVHIYENQIPMIEEQLERIPRSLPKLEIGMPNLAPYWSTDEMKNEHFDFDKFIMTLTPKSFGIFEYDPYPTIKIPLSVGI